jgi:hypothetical protein
VGNDVGNLLAAENAHLEEYVSRLSSKRMIVTRVRPIVTAVVYVQHVFFRAVSTG